MFAGMAAIFAVIVVPRFSPNTMAQAISYEIHPWLHIINVMAMVAEEDCKIIVNTDPIKKKSRMDPYPISVNCCKKESMSGLLCRFGTLSFRNAIPIKRRANPIMNSPKDFLLLLEEKIKGRDKPIRGKAAILMSNLNPKKEISQAVRVVPILAPIITPMD